jgi:hypothetical protein
LAGILSSAPPISEINPGAAGTAGTAGAFGEHIPSGQIGIAAKKMWVILSFGIS